MINVGIIGATGYTGVELVRLLIKHPQVSLSVVTSNSESGRQLSDVFPNLRGFVDLSFKDHDSKALNDCDVVFYATPHATAMETVPGLLQADCKIIDLSADFRLSDAAEWKQWYGIEHASPEFLSEAVYGLPEINRDRIKQARLVANPGCYPTAISLALIPALEAGLIDPANIIADAKSGVSGAGRKASMGSQFAEASENFKAYGLSGHRHLPEMLQTLTQVANSPVGLSFVPHLTPMVRGIFASVYTMQTSSADVQLIYEKRYANEPFVDLMPVGSEPDTRSTRGSNLCRIAVHPSGEGGRLILLSVIDNLVKGAAGQAIQNMNIMSGFKEEMGLNQPGLYP